MWPKHSLPNSNFILWVSKTQIVVRFFCFLSNDNRPTCIIWMGLEKKNHSKLSEINFYKMTQNALNKFCRIILDQKSCFCSPQNEKYPVWNHIWSQKTSASFQNDEIFYIFLKSFTPLTFSRKNDLIFLFLKLFIFWK